MENRDALIRELTHRLRSYTKHELIVRLRANNVPCTEVRTISEALEDPQLQARRMVVDIPQDQLRMVRTLGNPIKLSRTPAVIDRPPPALGEHNDEILTALRNSASSNRKKT